MRATGVAQRPHSRLGLLYPWQQQAPSLPISPPLQGQNSRRDTHSSGQMLSWDKCLHRCSLSCPKHNQKRQANLLCCDFVSASLQGMLCAVSRSSGCDCSSGLHLWRSIWWLPGKASNLHPNQHHKKLVGQKHSRSCNDCGGGESVEPLQCLPKPGGCWNPMCAGDGSHAAARASLRADARVPLPGAAVSPREAAAPEGAL